MASDQQTPQDDPFDSLLHLESQFYTEGYNQGAADGVLAGRIEGRQLGLEKGYQKFLEAGRLYGRAIVWANRLPNRGSSSSPPAPSQISSTTEIEAEKRELPPLPNNPRLEKHITTLYALVETESLSMENTDEAVNDFDDRIKRGQGKAKIIERMVGEKPGGEESGAANKGTTV
ncbi:hypothetical protein QBC40DRAFT_339062 [Triangularia verruculosa]|uniref:Essential protein Yae1 N-terminal domain-containing protein n=1 Tax=Triangularia verruculosa TaxID=2587418 RepID=A0AAN6XPA7_9PEZI|nr:hypothetical protein QBC40DRAFT_339062 [Triangularia verruculosa]